MRHILISVILILGILYSINYFDTNNIEILEDKNEIIIPVTVHLIDDGTVQFTTHRTINNIYSLFEEVNRIWGPAQIRFEVEEIQINNIENKDFKDVLAGDIKPLLEKGYIKEGSLNGYFARYLNVNGQAFPEYNIFFVGDLTTVNDYRTTAHEIGHLLVLKHVPDRSYLMYKGSNGEYLSEEEIRIARDFASILF